MQQIVKLLWVVGLLFQVVLVYAAPAQIETLSFFQQQSERLVFDVKGNPRYRYFTLQNPSRFVVDFEDTSLLGPIKQPPASHPLVVKVRSAVRSGKDYRVVIELNADVKASVESVDTDQGMRLQVDLVVDQAAKKSAAKSSRKSGKAASAPSKKAFIPRGRDIVVAIDAGHGGKDVGAEGRHGTREKDVVLAIAKRLQEKVNRQPGMRAVMIRDGDYFVKLRERVRIAKAAKADLFVSIHADAFDDPSAHGASIYTLATKGASSQMAQYLANSENASDGVADVQDDTLATVLMDLTNKAAKEASQHFGNKVLKNVKAVGHLHKSSVQKAGFMVLKSPIPSVLVETAFISNPEEERRLNSSAYQKKMATAVFKGIVAHFKRYAPADTLFAQLQKSGKSALRVVSIRHESFNNLNVASADKVINGSSKIKHVISRGDTLSGIARQYGVSMRAIRTVNDMDSTTVKVGQVIQIPRSS